MTGMCEALFGFEICDLRTLLGFAICSDYFWVRDCGNDFFWVRDFSKDFFGG